MRTFYDFNRSIPQEREEQYKLFPAMSLYHIALREELGEEEYQQFYKAEREAQQQITLARQQRTGKWMHA